MAMVDDQKSHQKDDPDPPAEFRLGDCIVRRQELTIEREGQSFLVEPKVMELLLTLIRRPGEVFTRSELVETVWQTEHGGDESLSRAVSLLRKALGDTRGAHHHIRTIPKQGYQLIAEVGPVVSGAEEHSAAQNPDPVSSSSNIIQPNTSAPPASTGFNLRWAALVAVVVLAGALALSFRPWDGKSPAGPSLNAATADLINPVPPLPPLSRSSETVVYSPPVYRLGQFNRAGDGQDDRAERLKTTIQTLFVRHGLVFLPESQTETPGAGVIQISARIDAAETGEQVSVQLSDARTDALLFALPLRVQATETITADQFVAIELYQLLSCYQLISARLQSSAQADLRRAVFQICAAESDWRKIRLAVDAIGDGLPADSSGAVFLEGWIALSMAGEVRVLGNVDLTDDAISLVETVLTRDPVNGPAVLANALLLEDVSLAEREALYQSAIRNAPEFAVGYAMYSHFLANVGRTRDAEAQMSQAWSLQPYSDYWGAYSVLLGFERMNFQSGDYRLAKLREYRPDDAVARLMEWYAHHWWGYAELARQMSFANGLSDGQIACQQAYLEAKLPEDNRLILSIDMPVSSAAREAIETVCEGNWYSQFGMPIGNVSSFRAALGDSLGALRALNLEFEERYSNDWNMFMRGPRLIFQPHFADVRAEEGFFEYAARAGLTEYWLETGNWPDFCAAESSIEACEAASRRAMGP